MKKVLPLTGTEWANKYYKLASGSSQEEGQWETLPFQVAILNMMCNRAIRRLVFQKSARIGWSKMLIAMVSCMLHQYKTNTVIYQPTDDDAKNFTIDEIDGAWEEMPIMRRIFPFLFAKDQNNTTKKKVGAGWTLDILGAGTPKNMRRITKALLCGDEIDGWDWELGKEGDPIALAKTRLEGAAFPMERWGTTPTNAGESHVEKLMKSAELTFRFYLPCPHCGHEQVLEWGGKDVKHGFKWDTSKTTNEAKAKTAHYCCIGCEQAIYFRDLMKMELAGRWMAEDMTWTKDGLSFFDADNNPVPIPVNVGIHCWAAYNPKMTDGWVGLVREFLNKHKDPSQLKTFINLILGELWEGENKDRPDWELIKRTNSSVWWIGERRKNPVPAQAVLVTCGMDTQDDRIEGSFWAWGPGEECWLVDHIVVHGDLSNDATKKAVQDYFFSLTFKRTDGVTMTVPRFGWDAMGHKTDDVYAMSRKHGPLRVIPLQGANKYGKPIANMPKKKNDKKVYLTTVGTDNAKALLYSRLKLSFDSSETINPGYIHFPADDSVCGDEYFKQLCSANKKLETVQSRQVWRWHKSYTFDEALDCWVYAYVAMRICVDRFFFDLDTELKPETKQGKSMKELAEALGGNE